MITPDTPLGEVLPAETVRQLVAFLEQRATGQVVLDCKDGLVLKGSVTQHWRETCPKPA